METVVLAFNAFNYLFCFKPTYKEWKHGILESKEFIVKVLSLPTRNGNLNSMKLPFIKTIAF